MPTADPDDGLKPQEEAHADEDEDEAARAF
jgi:hypothetical protein